MPVYIERPDLADLYDPMTQLPPIQCGACGNIADIQQYDCLGADAGNLFCNQCGEELRDLPAPKKRKPKKAANPR